MKIYADIRQEVYIEPIEVIEGLMEKVSGCDGGWIFEEDGKYYRGWERSAGVHSVDMKDEIPKKVYDYYQSLELVRSYIKTNNIK